MKIKVKLLGTGKEEDPYRPDVEKISWTMTEYDQKEGWAIIEISKEDYEKIKDKIIEVIEE